MSWCQEAGRNSERSQDAFDAAPAAPEAERADSPFGSPWQRIGDRLVDRARQQRLSDHGLHNLGKVDHVVVRNFTVKNANNEGILITNASDVTIAGNHVTGNNQGLVLLTVTCPTLVPPDSEAGEGFY